MDLKRLYEILGETTIQLRKGDVVYTEPSGAVVIDAMPHVDEAPAGIEAVDLEFLVVGVEKAAAEKNKAELIEILKTYPDPDRLASGPSYIEIGAEIGDQVAAFQLFALGKVLALWDVITPAALGITGDDARILAGRGFIMMTGFKAAA